jgi:hypothetical protein
MKENTPAHPQKTFVYVFGIFKDTRILVMKALFILMISVLSQKPAMTQSRQIDIPAKDFLKSLNDEQRQKAIYKLDDQERYNWHYFPKSDRKGISLNELTGEQKEKALALLKSCLSTSGYTKTVDIMNLESVLRVLENRADNEYRNSGKYFIIIFGEPHPTGSWGWRFEGHHISFSFAAMNNTLISGTPGFLGANPAVVPSGPQKGKQALKEETEAAFSFLRSLTSEQLQTAVSKSGAPDDIITFVSKEAKIESNEGISYTALTPSQQALFMKLIHIYIHRYTKLFADDMIKELSAAGLTNLRFLWAGAQSGEGKGYYYRIQGPTIIIEFDNTQGNANHIHSVVRDLKNDFGGDALLDHYRKEHQK